MDKVVTSKSIDGITDLVIWAPIKEGFIDAFENITFETRLTQVASALHKIRKSAREHETIAPFADTAERILTLLNFRIGVVDKDLFEAEPDGEGGLSVRPKRYMYLVATFDGPWEPYIRLIWKPLGPFLDLLLCNCEGYITAEDHSFEEYAGWVRDHQLDSAIFYSTTGLTVKDQLYLDKLEKLQREKTPAQAEEAIARMTGDDPMVLAKQTRIQSVANARTTTRLALEALTVLYRLADYYPPDRLTPTKESPDAEGRYLLRITHDLLHDWPQHDLPDLVKQAYAAPLAWFNLGRRSAKLPKIPPKLPDRSQIQKGLLSTYDSKKETIKYGALLLLQITDAKRFRKFLKQFPFSWEDDSPTKISLFDKVYRNIAFTFNGLERLGVAQEELDNFPKEFVDGMEVRGPQIGDVGNNHPRRWRLPARNWPPADAQGMADRPPIKISEIDAIIQLRSSEDKPKDPRQILPPSVSAGLGYQAFLTSGEKLEYAFDQKFESLAGSSALEILIILIGHFGKETGATLIGVEDMFRPDAIVAARQGKAEKGSIYPNIDHFGFRDGVSQPHPVKKPKGRDEVPFGDLLLGYHNSLGDQPTKLNNLMHNSSFLAIRKLRQDVGAMTRFLDKYEKREGSREWIGDDEFAHGELAAHLVGRWRDGEALIQPAIGNDFDYKQDENGEQCPFQAHIRRANPRVAFQGRPAPRILRRGMSYGQRYASDPHGERGLMFMAYNADISEQFEVIQRWINGANSTDTYSAHRDPLLGDVISGEPRTYRFVNRGKVTRVKIDEPFVQLEWGAYLFAPSRGAIKHLSKISDQVSSPSTSQIENGTQIIERLLALDADSQRFEWKILLEDFLAKDPEERSKTPDVWAAINANGGALRLESGVAMQSCPHAGKPSIEDKTPVVLVGDEKLVMEVLSDYKTYSVKRQGERSRKTFGEIYVAQDPGKKYYQESTDTNEILIAYDEEEAFNDAYSCALQVFGILKATATRLGASSLKMEVRRQYLRPTLSLLCAKWFGIPDGKFIEAGTWGWEGLDGGKPICPGDFMAPSRMVFYPRPTAAIEKYGIEHGRGLIKAATALVKASRGGVIKGKIAAQMFAKIDDDDILALNLIGSLTGALPPVDGNLRGIFYDWLNNDLIWRYQGELHRAAAKSGITYEAAAGSLRIPMMESISKRPAPDLLFRTALKDAEIGSGDTRVKINKGETVIVGLVSATQSRLANDLPPDVSVVFGGVRHGARQPEHSAVHACPAYKLAMGAMLGIATALLDAGQIKALPASQILEISGWK